MGPDDDFLVYSAVILAGVGVTFAFSARYADTLSLYLTGRQYTLVAGSLFGLVAWTIQATVEFDRPNAVAAAALMPAVLIAGGFPFLASLIPDAVSYLASDGVDVLFLVGVFTVAAVAAVALETGIDRLAERRGPVPATRVVAVATLGLLVAATVAGGVFTHTAADSTTVAAVESGTGTDDRPRDHHTPSLQVTLAGKPGEVRLQVTAPDGSAALRRVPPDAFENGTATLRVPFYRFEPDDPRPGTYRITVRSVPGLPVDSEPYTLEEGPVPSLESVETAESPAAISLGPTDYRSDHELGAGADVTVGVVAANTGDIADDVVVTVLVDGDQVALDGLVLEAGQRAGYLIGLDAETVDRARERADGTVTVRVSAGGQQERVTVELP